MGAPPKMIAQKMYSSPSMINVQLQGSRTWFELCHIAAHLMDGASNVVSLVGVGGGVHEIRHLPVLRV